MLPKVKRLTVHDFKTRERFSSLHADHLFVRFRKAENFKAAVVISKKTAKTSVARNKVRRTIYSILSLHKEYFSLHYHFIFSIKKVPLSKVKEVFEKEIESVLKKISQ